MVDANASSHESRFDPRVLQLAMAFGQGTGTMLATEEAVKTALASLTAYLEKSSVRWNRDSLKFIEYARALGTVAAVAAAGDRAFVIGREHVETALNGIERNLVEPLICNC